MKKTAIALMLAMTAGSAFAAAEVTTAASTAGTTTASTAAVGAASTTAIAVGAVAAVAVVAVADSGSDTATSNSTSVTTK
ncbi:hypothetical protein ACU5DF_17920 [Aliivibrio wodanis]|uniref:Uncharacterized protein n=1 Tax=Aliivibrio wodanis TaxID=80852 RepID=A0A5Q4ZQN6_9GAMM|nr:hypothetical protein AW0309160_00172 [Aliivibrio wodanis]